MDWSSFQPMHWRVNMSNPRVHHQAFRLLWESFISLLLYLFKSLSLLLDIVVSVAVCERLSWSLESMPVRILQIRWFSSLQHRLMISLDRIKSFCTLVLFINACLLYLNPPACRDYPSFPLSLSFLMLLFLFPFLSCFLFFNVFVSEYSAKPCSSLTWSSTFLGLPQSFFDDRTKFNERNYVRQYATAVKIFFFFSESNVFSADVILCPISNID